MGVEEVAKLIANYGALTAMAILFIISWLQEKKKTNALSKTSEELAKTNSESLIVLSESNSNIAKTLEILQQNYDRQSECLRNHDNRVVEFKTDVEIIKSDVKVIKDKLERRK